MTIKITYSAIDGFRKTRSFKTLAGARKFALDRVGPQDVDNCWYAVSNDGVGKITWDGCTRAELFGEEVKTSHLNATNTFYAKGNDLFCRHAGSTHDHANQHFGRIMETMDEVTGDHPAGWGVFHTHDNDCRNLFDEDRRFATRTAALAYAKECYLAWLDYLDNGPL